MFCQIERLCGATIIFITAFYQSEVYIMAMLEWWQKAKGMIQSIYDSVTYGNRLCHKALESYRGFLVYIR
jgi:hypothetical protein